MTLLEPPSKEASERRTPETPTGAGSLPTRAHDFASAAPTTGSVRKREPLPDAAEGGTGRARPDWRHPGVLLGVVVLAAGAGTKAWLARPIPVPVFRAAYQPVVETVSASGRVGGRREIAVAAQTPGVVAALFVDRGDKVRAGQPLARIIVSVADAQVQQAEQAVATARAAVRQASAEPLPSEVEAARSRGMQARAAVSEANAEARRAAALVRQAEAGVAEADARVAQAQAGMVQTEARYQLAYTSLFRQTRLFREGAVSQQSVDVVAAERSTAEATNAAAYQNEAVAQASAKAARAALDAARQAQQAANLRVSAAFAASRIARADLRSLLSSPRPEAVSVARQRVHDAEAALSVARAQVRSSVVLAPFAATVTARLTEAGGAVNGGSGVVRLVETALPRIRADVDESELPRLRVGERAVVTAPAYPAARVAGRVTRIASQVDAQRGTVEVEVTPQHPPAWLLPGQTVDVNVIVSEAQPRIVVPATTLRPSAGSSGAAENTSRSVFVVREGRVAPVTVTVGAASGATVPVLSGLAADDLVVIRAAATVPGARVVPRFPPRRPQVSPQGKLQERSGHAAL